MYSTQWGLLLLSLLLVFYVFFSSATLLQSTRLFKMFVFLSRQGHKIQGI